MVNSKSFLWFELTVLFTLLPLLYLTKIWPFHPILLLVLSLLYVLLYIEKKPLKKLFTFKKYSEWKSLLRRFLLVLTLTLIIVFLFIPEKLFSFLIEKPTNWTVIMLLYPLFSALPQEIIYRYFFFKRYEALANERNLLFLNAFLFGFMHIIFQNAVAVLATLIGGYIFARTYQKSDSLGVVWVEHTLYGWLIFTVGIGSYFYHGSVH